MKLGFQKACIRELCFVEGFFLANSCHTALKTVILVAVNVKIEMISLKCLLAYFTLQQIKQTEFLLRVIQVSESSSTFVHSRMSGLLGGYPCHWLMA